MAEAQAPAAAAPAAAAPAEGKGNGNGKRNNHKKKEQKPIEELYDLSKPIPRVSAVFLSPADELSLPVVLKRRRSRLSKHIMVIPHHVSISTRNGHSALGGLLMTRTI